jgi:molecular chaperone HtpG
MTPVSAETQQSYSFQAEVVQLLDLMIHSLYSNKEIFLRELISNSSDAIDRLRLERLTSDAAGPDDAGPDDAGPDDDGPLVIRVSWDSGAKTITIADNGIGMSRDEVIANLGTIARSGTAEFLRSLSGDQRRDATLIGQFGVGFYSAFIVADRVSVTTRRNGLPAGAAVRWESDGRGAYTLEPADRPDRGTTIVLHLRDGEEDLLSGHRLRSIVRRYSDHVSQPILMPAEGDSSAAETVNRASALWARPKSDLTEADYHAFYQHVAGDFADPLGYLHAKIEGAYEYTLLLFIPSRAPFDLWIPEVRQGVRLHVRRVFIMADTGQLMPAYLRFVRGVIDSGDLPLNVSRELLQGSRVADQIRATAVKRVLRLLGDIAANDTGRYAAFWREFGTVLKEGIPEDYDNRDDIAKLLRFTTTATARADAGGAGGAVSTDADASLAGYVARMKDGQDKIYYLLAPTPAAAASSPHLEAFRARGIEVLLLGDPVDGWVVSSLREFDGHPLQSVAQGAPDFGGVPAAGDDTAAGAGDEAGDGLDELVAKLKEALGGAAAEVRVTSRLTTSPACIVADDPDSELSLARRLHGSGMPARPVLEINPGHPLIRRLNRDLADPHLADWAHVLFSQAVLTLGARIDEPAAFVTRLNDLLVSLAGDGEGP